MGRDEPLTPGSMPRTPLDVPAGPVPQECGARRLGPTVRVYDVCMALAYSLYFLGVRKASGYGVRTSGRARGKLCTKLPTA